MEFGESKQLEPERFARWYGLYARRVFAFVLGVLKDSDAAEEVLQSTFAKAHACGGGVVDEKALPWLFQVAFREALLLQRKERADNSRLQKSAKFCDSKPDAVLPEQLLLTQESVAKVRLAVAGLPEALQEVVRLRVYEELTFQQIADRLEIPLGTVLTRMRTALGRLKSSLSEHLADDGN